MLVITSCSSFTLKRIEALIIMARLWIFKSQHSIIVFLLGVLAGTLVVSWLPDKMFYHKNTPNKHLRSMDEVHGKRGENKLLDDAAEHNGKTVRLSCLSCDTTLILRMKLL